MKAAAFVGIVVGLFAFMGGYRYGLGEAKEYQKSVDYERGYSDGRIDQWRVDEERSRR